MDRIIRIGASSYQRPATRKALQPAARMTPGNTGWEAPQAGQLSWQLTAGSQQPRAIASARNHAKRQPHEPTEIGCSPPEHENNLQTFFKMPIAYIFVKLYYYFNKFHTCFFIPHFFWECQVYCMRNMHIYSVNAAGLFNGEKRSSQ